MTSLSWVWYGCDPQLQAEIAAGVHDIQYPRLRDAYLDAMSEAFLQGAVAELPTTSTIN